ncbi:MAG: Asp23/Gls24 family envelope stress response protein [Lachnospiraceae bacterium]|nr:Asp23/Gls24 family envelope stress response protein [Lachnospiraceae bacterium]
MLTHGGKTMQAENVESNVKIANDVVGKIATIAALEADGVAAMGNNITTEVLSKVGMKNIMKNVKVDIFGHDVKIDILITVKYGINIPAVSSVVQDKIKQAVENMTSLSVSDVNVRIAGIDLPENR